MLSTASMATMEPMRRPRVSAPWQTKRAPPSSSTIAMCSGERKPSGAACSVVNETTWPTPRTVVGVIGTGCHGHQVAGGATTASQRGHREASIVSIMAVRAAGGYSSCVFLHERHPVVRREPADGVREPDAARDLTLAGAARELPDALDHLREPGGGQRMAACLEPAGGIDGQAAVERRLAVEGDASRLARRHQPEVLERDQLERGERVMELGEVDARGAEAGHGERRARRVPRRPEVR